MRDSTYKADQDGTDHDGAEDPIDTAERRRLGQVRPGKAVAYAVAHWSGLTAILDDGRIEIDSNINERSMKCVAFTRKNALFVAAKHIGPAVLRSTP
ncbi:transposase [Mesorhizobium intechi]|nr:transposase [Mesorhizobium intechi]